MHREIFLAATSGKNEARTISPARLQPAKRDQILVGRSNRFGFRQNVVRPASSIQPRISEFSVDNVNNNNNLQISKIRPKSASNSSQYRTNPDKTELQTNHLNANTK